jgi:hypothetical protein
VKQQVILLFDIVLHEILMLVVYLPRPLYVLVELLVSDNGERAF